MAAFAQGSVGDPDNIWRAAFFDPFIIGMTIATLLNITRHFPTFVALFAVHTFMVGVVKDRVTSGTCFDIAAIPGMVTSFTLVGMVFFVNENGGFSCTCGISFSYPDDPGWGLGCGKCHSSGSE